MKFPIKTNQQRRTVYKILRNLGFHVWAAQRIRDWTPTKIQLAIDNSKIWTL